MIEEALQEITSATSPSSSSPDDELLVTRCLSMMLLHLEPRQLWAAALALYVISMFLTHARTSSCTGWDYGGGVGDGVNVVC